MQNGEARILYAGLVSGQRRLALYPEKRLLSGKLPGIRIQTENTTISIWVAIMVANTTTPDGYYVDENGVWDGNASTTIAERKKPWPWRRQRLGAN